MSVRRAVAALAPYHFTPHQEPIKLDQNESPYDLPEALKARVLARLAETPFNRYPELTAPSLRAKLGRYHNWPAEGIVISNGSNVLIQALVTTAALGGRVLSVEPTFSVYRLQAALQDARFEAPLLGPGFSLPLAELLQRLQGEAGVLFLANPAAPTGNLFAEADLRTLANASRDWLFVIDEAYHQYANSSALPLVNDFSHVISLRTFSKAFGLGGVRLGYALMHPELAAQVQKTLLPFSISALQLTVAEVLLDDAEFIERILPERLEETRAERARVLAELQQLPGITPYPSETNFILLRCEDAAGIYHGLLRAGIVVRRQDHLPQLAGCLRVSIGAPQDNDAFITALRQQLEVHHV
jgi:histidinol-phosphate aminotransferase